MKLGLIAQLCVYFTSLLIAATKRMIIILVLFEFIYTIRHLA
jgi:hypothetical protein